MPACLRCRNLVDTKVLVYVLCCSAAPIEGCSAVLAVCRYYGFRSLVYASWCSEKGKTGSKTKASLFVFLGGHIARNSRADDTASFVSKQNTSPAVMFTSRLVLPSAMTWTEKSACVANLPRSHKHTRGLPVLLLLLWCCCIALGCCGAATTAAYVALLSSRHL